MKQMSEKEIKKEASNMPEKYQRCLKLALKTLTERKCKIEKIFLHTDNHDSFGEFVSIIFTEEIENFSVHPAGAFGQITTRDLPGTHTVRCRAAINSWDWSTCGLASISLRDPDSKYL